MKFTVLSLNAVKVQSLKSGKREVESAYAKRPVPSALLAEDGFESDQQADLKNHGGRDKAVCVFSSHHFEKYSSYLGREMPVPAFGENLTVDTAEEKYLYIGDVFESSTVRVQISQPRQPCSKTGMFHGENGVIKFMAQSGATGFYFRVLSGGEVSQGDVFTLVESDQTISLSAANDIMYGRNKNNESLIELIEHPFLSAAWKDELSGKL